MTSHGGIEDVDANRPELIVVVPARNEVRRVRDCLSSLGRQEVPVRVFFSDNTSDDGTLAAARDLLGDLDLVVRTTALVKATEHFVSAGRWALEAEPEAAFFAFLAGDDTWSPGFARAALRTLVENPDVGAVFPAFVWEAPDVDRWLPPVAFRQRSPVARQWRALLLPDHRELANLAYGVHRRDAFVDLLAAWERGGDHFGSDYAAVWQLLGAHKVQVCPDAVGRRYVREGADLIERVGLRRDEALGRAAMARLYVRLNVRVNGLLAVALQRVVTAGTAPPRASTVQLTRAPQWLWGAVRQVRGLGASGTTGTV